MQVRNCQTLKDPKRTYKRNGGQIMTYDLNITFDDNLVTGNETIDTQHKELIDRIQNFVTACQNGDSKVKAIKMLDYLDEYTDRNCMNTFRSMKDQQISSVNLYRKM